MLRCRAARLPRQPEVSPLLWFVPFLAALCIVALARPALSNGETTISHGISVFGDLKYPAGFPHFDYVNPDAPKGGTMRFRGTTALNTFDSLNPFILKGNAAQGLALMHDSLLAPSADEPDSYYGMIAMTLEYPADRSWVIFTMNPEARFSDGEPIEASDVVFSHRVLVEQGHPFYANSYRDIDTVEALGSHELKVTFVEGAATRDLITEAGSIPVLPEHYYETVAFDESTMVPPVSSGGYVVADADPGRSIQYCRNPDYWAWEHPVNVGAGNFDCYVYEYFADHTAAFEALKSGDYIFHQEYISKNWATAYDFPALDNGWVVREVLQDDRPSGTQGYWINMRRDKFKDPRVREAIGMMFNFEWTNETLFYGLYNRTDSFFENSAMQAEGIPTGDELAFLKKYQDQLPPEIFTEPAFSPPVYRSGRIDRASTRRAASLLDEAGWTLEGGVRVKDGQQLTLEILDDGPSLERITNPFIQNLKRIGIEAKLTIVDAAQNEERRTNYDFDVYPARLPGTGTPSTELRYFYGSEAAKEPGTLNVSGVSDPVVDGLIEDALAAESRNKMEAALRALDRVLRSQHIWVPQWYSGTYFVAYWDVFGKPDQKPLYARGDAYWWWDEEKYQRLKDAGAPLP